MRFLLSNMTRLTLLLQLLVTTAVIGYGLPIIRTAGSDASISRVLGQLLELPSTFVV
jgi:hypothetical protein